MYISIYESICTKGKTRKASYKPFSDLHKHHIIPKHMGGSEEETNFTYLSIREHKIAHFLLWKIYKSPNDLRSMYMLGAYISSFRRKIMGKWCFENKIGFHNSKWDSERAEWRKRGYEKQKETADTNNFYFWSTEQGRKRRASLGGKKGGAIQKEFGLGIFAIPPEQQRINSSLGGKALKGRICMYKLGEGNFKRIRPEDKDYYLSLGYIVGTQPKQ